MFEGLHKKIHFARLRQVKAVDSQPRGPEFESLCDLQRNKKIPFKKYVTKSYRFKYWYKNIT
jgi:hypothetical protein